MKVGDLVVIVQGGKLVSPWTGETGVILDEYAHPQSSKPGWFEVMLADRKIKPFQQDYLEVVS